VDKMAENKKMEPNTDKKRTTMIIIISVVAVLAIALLLFFSDAFVGKAFYDSSQDVTQASFKSEQDTVGQPFFQKGVDNTLVFKANIKAKESVAFKVVVDLKEFEAKFPDDCEANVILFPNANLAASGAWDDTFYYCDLDGKKLTIEHATLNFNDAITGDLDLFAIKVKPISVVGSGVKKVKIAPIVIDILDLDSQNDLITSDDPNAENPDFKYEDVVYDEYSFTINADGDGLSGTDDPCPYDNDESCAGGSGSTTEVCDGVDNTGDGKIDQDASGKTVCLTDAKCGSHTNSCSGATPKCNSEGVCVAATPPGDDNITITLLDGTNTVATTASTSTTKEYTVKVDITPDVALPANHLVITTIDYGSTQKVNFANFKTALAKDATETIQFKHKPVQSGGFKVKVVVWKNYVTPTSGPFDSLIDAKSVTYG
tara:strand:- start:766 stop:2052 length:1287 start_codon:yes stop_codon:yes gene_type:complete